MYKIKISGPAGRVCIDPDFEKVDNDFDLSTLDGVECQECFSDYIFDNRKGEEEHTSILQKGIRRGYMEFSYNKEENKLYVEVNYESNEKLTPRDLEVLIKYTQGQMSDGIGENFEQEPVRYKDGLGIYISPWFYGQKLVATQTEVIKKFGDM